MVANFAEQAILIGRAAGREKEVIAGLTHVGSIPMLFQGKNKVEEALLEAHTKQLVARADAELASVNQ